MRSSDWSSDVCSSDLPSAPVPEPSVRPVLCPGPTVEPDSSGSGRTLDRPGALIVSLDPADHVFDSRSQRFIVSLGAAARRHSPFPMNGNINHFLHALFTQGCPDLLVPQPIGRTPV